MNRDREEEVSRNIPNEARLPWRRIFLKESLYDKYHTAKRRELRLFILISGEKKIHGIHSH
jgi:hypothetical protein